ncbi:hypothetical protein [Pseudoalteromonas umbrosa]|uniref:hypothetical protein n=1 Tax=Pseudoalteromonas umbrosa TaxID=3048489 RepID=UPI0024C2BCAE|nr:hypothetical protein [Pseudoalteromonas sp. B95]MDK1290075.1 hypothetical protein [Pseudoalteromonas sp. B95]
MRWHVDQRVWPSTELMSNSRLLVIQEVEEVVLDTLLIRPSDNPTYWQERPDYLNLARLSELTVLGEFENVVTPAITGTFQLGFSLASSPKGITGKHEDHTWHHPASAEHFEFQLNQQRGALNHLLNNQEGTLLWIQTVSHHKDNGQYNPYWFTSSTKDVLTGTRGAVGAHINDPKAIAVKPDYNHPSLAFSHQAVTGMTLNSSQQTVLNITPLLQDKIATYPYEAG